MTTQIRVEEDPDYGLTHKVGSIILDFGVRGPELERELASAQSDFVMHMELRGLILYKHQGMPNPVWIENPDGSVANWYAIDWERKYKVSQRTETVVGPDGKEEVIDLPAKRAMSLEECEGEVEYRIVGIFWAPKQAVEILTSIADRKEAERLAKNPKVFGPGRLPQT
jgi:hypothetical protein